MDETPKRHVVRNRKWQLKVDFDFIDENGKIFGNIFTIQLPWYELKNLKAASEDVQDLVRQQIRKEILQSVGSGIDYYLNGVFDDEEDDWLEEIKHGTQEGSQG